MEGLVNTAVPKPEVVTFKGYQNSFLEPILRNFDFTFLPILDVQLESLKRNINVMH